MPYAQLENLLFRDPDGSPGSVRLIDFGLCSLLRPGEKLQGLSGSSFYIAPVTGRAAPPWGREGAAATQSSPHCCASRAHGMHAHPYTHTPPQEVLCKAAYDEKVDVWSCGAVAYTLLSGKPPFTGARQEAIWRRIVNDGVPEM
jgi:serine/threonine protein kinase